MSTSHGFCDIALAVAIASPATGYSAACFDIWQSRLA
jgi:hypothetical protein